MHVRFAVLAAQHVGDAISRMHVSSLADSASSTRELEWLRARLEREYQTARRILLPTLDSEWLAISPVEELVELYEVARIWRGRHIEVAQAEVRLLNTFRIRFGYTIGQYPSKRNDYEDIACARDLGCDRPEPRRMQP
jgi:hypothetical protein